MNYLKKQERAALEAVAKQYRATPEVDSDAAWLTVAGKRITVVIQTLNPHGAFPANVKPGLRFDKVATRVVERLRAACAETIPDGTTVLLTLTAPIRLASKTTAALEDKIRAMVGRGSPGRDVRDEIYGNRVRIRILSGGTGQRPKLIGFVHNPDTDPARLFNMTQGMLALLTAAAGGKAAQSARERWLIVISSAGISSLDAYRALISQLGMTAGFRKILMVFGDGRVEPLS